uniref:Prkr-interacting protein 1 n=1 Tax=Amblyomma triste TaxID=251400 RepID=A0A023GB80_AMBTT
MGDAESGELGVPTPQKPSSKKPRPTAPVVVPKNAYDVQRLKLEKLMEHPERPVLIPEPAKPRAPHEAPEFVRNVMGSSAGAGSGEFHVYRHLRRKEYARQKYIDQSAREDQLDAEFRERVERNRREAEERTAKKRAKRLRRKERLKERKTAGKATASSHSERDDETSSEEDEDDRGAQGTSAGTEEATASTDAALTTADAEEKATGEESTEPDDPKPVGDKCERALTDPADVADTNTDQTVEESTQD